MNNYRNSKIELVRIVGCLYILLGHSIGWINIWSHGYLYVDYFYMLIGFYITKKYSKNVFNINDSVCFSLKCTYNYFIKFLPYTIPAIISFYFGWAIKHYANGLDIQNIIFQFLHMPFDFVLLYDIHGKYFILWYLSSLLFVFPIFIICIVYKYSSVFKFIISYIAIYIFCFIKGFHIHSIPLHFFRAFAGLSFGMIAQYIYILLKQYATNKLFLKLFNILSILSFIIPSLVLPLLNKHSDVIFIFCFLIFIISSNIVTNYSNYFINYISSFTLPIFIWQPVIISIFNVFNINCYLRFLFELTTLIAISIINIRFAKFININKYKINLKYDE